SNAAGAITGMARAYESFQPAEEHKPLITATMFGVTTPCVTSAREWLERHGYEVLVFHATGAGGRSMEALISAGFIVGSLDITTTEWADELVGGVLGAGPQRLDAAGAKPIPQVVSLGALDMVNFGPKETVPAQFRERNLYVHNATVTLMRTTPEECAQLGAIIAQKLSAAKGPTALFVPLRGVSMIAAEGQPFYDPEADAALIGALKASLGPNVELHELDMEINDPRFAEAMAERLHQMLTA
ncbi:Tm-1-like ATP-binding domain-containing protein, partial [Oscillochloris sp. ZM17-4]|uniref:Tm-1-like ATP-binding domain-containing protein n=1 Tax=Oscillochloris sp. ZM17-4 TaxID=2866714 RepID=UPI001C732013